MIKSILSALLMGVFISSTMAASGNNSKISAYITADEDIKVFDADNDKVIGNINFPGTHPYKVDVSADGKVAYALLVGGAKSESIAIINTASNKQVGLVHNLKTIPSTWRHSLAIAPDTQFAYLGDDDETNVDTTNDKIIIIDTKTNSAIGTVKNYPADFYHYSIAFTPDSQTALAPGEMVTNDKMELSLLLIDTKSHTVTHKIDVPNHLSTFGMTISPDGKKAYLTSRRLNDKENEIIVVNLESKSIAKFIDFGLHVKNGEYDIAISPDGKNAYVLVGGPKKNENSYIYNIDTTTDTIVGSIKFSHPIDSFPVKISIHPNGKKAYVTYFDEYNHISIINIENSKVINTLEDEGLVVDENMVFFKTSN